MDVIIPFKGCKYGLYTPFDGWTQQCFDGISDFKGGRDVWGFLIDRFGADAKKPSGLRPLIGPFTRWIQKELALPDIFVYNNLKRSLTVKYGPEAFPLNVLLYINDKLKWTPEQFREGWLKWEFQLQATQIASDEAEGDDDE